MVYEIKIWKIIHKVDLHLNLLKVTFHIFVNIKNILITMIDKLYKMLEKIERKGIWRSHQNISIAWWLDRNFAFMVNPLIFSIRVISSFDLIWKRLTLQIFFVPHLTLLFIVYGPHFLAFQNIIGRRWESKCFESECVIIVQQLPAFNWISKYL